MLYNRCLETCSKTFAPCSSIFIHRSSRLGSELLINNALSTVLLLAVAQTPHCCKGQSASDAQKLLRFFPPNSSIRCATRAVHPVWCEAPSPEIHISDQYLGTHNKCTTSTEKWRILIYTFSAVSVEVLEEEQTIYVFLIIQERGVSEDGSRAYELHQPASGHRCTTICWFFKYFY